MQKKNELKILIMRRTFKMIVMAVMAIVCSHTVSAATITIPTAKGSYISWNDATGSGYTIENDGANVGSTGMNSICKFTINNTVQQDYTLTFALGSKYEAKLKVTLEGETMVLDKTVTIPNTGSWTPTEEQSFFIEQLPVGTYKLTFKVTQASSYAGNWGKLAFYAGDGMNHIPGTLTIDMGTYGGGAHAENNNDNVGYIVDGATAIYDFYCDEPGAYQISTYLQRYNQGGNMNIQITDTDTGNTEADGTYVIASTAPNSYTLTNILVPGELTKGRKHMTFTFSGGSSYICNYKALTFTKVADHYAGIAGVSIEGQTMTKGSGYDWNCNLPKRYNEGEVAFRLLKNNCSLTLTASNNGTPLAVTTLGDDTYSIPTPGYNEEAIVTAAVTPENEAVTNKLSYTLRIFHMGDPLLKKKTLSTMTGKNNCIVTLTFDREMQDAEATVQGGTTDVQHVVAEGGKSTLKFPVWDLEWNTRHTFTLTHAADLDGNTPADPITIDINVGSRPQGEKKVYDYVVGTTTELLNAIKALNSKGGTTRKTIFLKKGTYMMPEESTIITAQNVSLIGQAMDSVILQGTSKVDGHASALIKADGNGLYLQDLTLRTSHWRTGEFYGRVLAVYATNEKTVMKRVAMQGQQDTYLCGHRAYHEDCAIYGTVDFIYSGGDNFFHRNDIVIENRSGNVITAPATDKTQRWGMVFDSCTIKRAPGATLVTNGSYTLGRPWHNEPRTYYLNTRMEVLPSDVGWAGMSDVPTHFYEYNSMDGNGKPLNLSKRGNSSSSTNHYKPVLTDDEARLYTARRVLCGTDAWDAPAQCRQLAAPTKLTLDNNILEWQAVENARCYVICKNGVYLACTTATKYELDNVEAGATYSVSAANQMGGIEKEAQVKAIEPEPEAREKTPAFPGAEGYGRYVTGGRGGKVYHVTNLKDSGTGSFRWACEQSGTRTIVFDVSGTIHLKSQLKLTKGNVTIAGQTAPGDGICVADWDFAIAAPNVIIRYMRFRPSDTSQGEPDGLGGMDGKNIIVDHCSISWSVDECCSVYGNEHMTVQWSIVSQSLRYSTHSKTAHGYGGNWGGKGATYHHNLLAHHDSRTPRFGNRPTYVQQDTTDYRCNVIYNWSGNGCYGGEGMKVNMVNNYYKPGPATDQRATGSHLPLKYRICGLGVSSQEDNGSYHIWGKYFVDGNENADYPTLKEKNWEMGIYPQIATTNWGYTATTKDTMRLAEPLPFMAVTTHTAQQAYERVLEYAGASLHRDWVDSLAVSDTRLHRATYTGSGDGDLPGIIDTPYDMKPQNADDSWTPWPVLTSITPLTDTDGDGMPDEWEIRHGLNPNNTADGNIRDQEGYTNLEHYLNSIVAHITEAQNEGGIMEGYLEYATEDDITGAVTIPTDYLDPYKADITVDATGRQAAKILNDSFDSFSHGDKATFRLNCKTAGSYTFKFDAATTRSDFKLLFAITDEATGAVETKKTVSIANTGNWQQYKTCTFDTDDITEGIKTLAMTWQSSSGQYTGNVKNISISLKQTTGIMIQTTDNVLDNSTLYDLQGRRTLYPQRGLYIYKGKKVVLK